MRHLMCAALLGFSLMAGPVSAELRDDIAADLPDLLALYFHLHQNPELSLREVETAKRLATEMRALGFEVTEGVGGTGVVSVLENGDGPTVLIRADMDALPVKEATGLPYASKATGINPNGDEVPVMHACGHDVHMTVFIGTARRLMAMKDDWSGTLVMINQPAEEIGKGALAMLNDGLFERFPRPDYNLALHVSPDLPAGHVAATPGFAMANVDSVDVHVHGLGGHGAYPHAAKDPIVLASQIVVDLQTLISREISPLDPAVVTVGSIHGGTKHNVIPNDVMLQLTVRSYKQEVREALLNGIERVAHGQAKANGLPEDLWPVVTIKDEYTPAAYNHPELSHRALDLFADLFGADNVSQPDPQMGGEDFGRYGQVEPKIPSLLFRLGTIDPEQHAAFTRGEVRLPPLHSDSYAPLPEPSIATGVRAMTELALELLAER